jgi:hypothetical protein
VIVWLPAWVAQHLRCFAEAQDMEDAQYAREVLIEAVNRRLRTPAR